MAKHRIAVIGFGKIARDQHLPAIAADAGFELCAVVDRNLGSVQIPAFADHLAMLAAVSPDAVAICTPPGPRYRIACDCLAAGAHVLLEKPPTLTLGEGAALRARADAAGRTLFAAWHAQFAAGVARAAAITREEGIVDMRIDWREDVNKWHPGQDWIWAPGGFGVFDPGINALSIATRLSAARLLVLDAELTMHADLQQPEAARLSLACDTSAARFSANFDWREQQDERWQITATTPGGRCVSLSGGGACLRIDDVAVELAPQAEYPSLYRHFAMLIGNGTSEMDMEPLRITEDALLIARRTPAAGSDR